MQLAIKTQEITPNIIIIHTWCANFFIYRKAGTTICFDTGFRSRGIQKKLAPFGITPDAVSHVFLTHHDFDHTGGVKAFQNAAILFSKLEEPIVRGQLKRLPSMHQHLAGRSYKTLQHNETISIDTIQIRAISTPGHTIGSMSYLVDNCALFVGDTIELRKNKATTGSSILNTDVKQQESSLRLLARINDVKYLCTSHSGVSTDFSKAMLSWRIEAS